jgi:hypothetical protein
MGALNNAATTANLVVTRPGIARDLLDRALDLQQAIGQSQQTINNTWSQVTQQPNGPSLPGDQFDAFEDRVSEVVESARQLNIAAQNDLELFQKAREQVRVDKAEFESARDFHRKLSTVGLCLIVVALVAGVLLVLRVFVDFSQSAITSAGSPDTVDRVARIALLFGGRIALLVGLGWLLHFLFRFHTNHAAQAVSYQDRLAGLGAAELVLQSGSTSTRSQVVLLMAETYLSLKENAFRHPGVHSSDEFRPALGDLEKVFGLVSKVMK